MPRSLFVYGSLLFDEVQRAVVGRVLRSEPAVLTGYACRRVHGQPYPAVRPDPEAETSGRLCHDVDLDTLRRLDHYEGAVYERRTAQVTTASGAQIEAEVYVLADAYASLLSDEPWNRDDFARRRLAGFLAAIRHDGADDHAQAPGTR